MDSSQDSIIDALARVPEAVANRRPRIAVFDDLENDNDLAARILDNNGPGNNNQAQQNQQPARGGVRVHIDLFRKQKKMLKQLADSFYPPYFKNHQHAYMLFMLVDFSLRCTLQSLFVLKFYYAGLGQHGYYRQEFVTVLIVLCSLYYSSLTLSALLSCLALGLWTRERAHVKAVKRREKCYNYTCGMIWLFTSMML